MRKLRIVLAVCSLLPLAVVAQNAEPPAAEQHSEHEHAAASDEAGGHSMGAMHEHMQLMREQMTRIHAAEDPAERQRLMQEHMQSMQQYMQMMGPMRPGPAGAARRCAEGDAACRMDQMRAENGMMRERMSMMEERLESMQELMQQMMDHFDEAQR